MKQGSTAKLILVAAISAFCLSVAGCNAADTLKRGLEHSKAVSAQLETSVGVKSQVGFNWNNGALAVVTVQFDGMPEKQTLPEIADLCRDAVKKEFKQTPQHLIVSFAIAP